MIDLERPQLAAMTSTSVSIPPHCTPLTMQPSYRGLSRASTPIGDHLPHSAHAHERTRTARRLRCESAGSCSPLTAKPATSPTDHGSSRAQMYAYDARLPIALYNGGRLSTSLVTLLTAGPEQAGTATSYRAALNVRSFMTCLARAA